MFVLQIYNNGVAGLHITGSYNVTFEATIDNSEEVFLGEGNVGRLNGQQPIEIIIESSTLVIFNDMRVTSSNGETFALYVAAPSICA